MNKERKIEDFLDTFCKEGFLQSEQWRIFQENEGKKTFHLEDISKSKKGEVVLRIWANIIEHTLPVVGKYFYIPRGPVIRGEKDINLIRTEDMKKSLDYLIWLSKDNGAGWVRFDPRSDKDLVLIKESLQKIFGRKIRVLKKSPHDMQPREILVVDISKSEQDLLMEMKSKTRYNIKLAQKKGVVIHYPVSVIKKEQYLREFLRLNRETAERDGIITHRDEHYRKMLESFPEDVLRIYVAEYQGKIIAANLMVFFGDTAIYLHGASSNENRDVMAPYLLQWRQILDAKEKGCGYYDFGGVKIVKRRELTPTPSLLGRGGKGAVDSWSGITRFKTGFSPKTEPVVFPGSYDIITSSLKYGIYKNIQFIKMLFKKIYKQWFF